MLYFVLPIPIELFVIYVNDNPFIVVSGSFNANTCGFMDSFLPDFAT